MAQLLEAAAPPLHVAISWAEADTYAVDPGAEPQPLVPSSSAVDDFSALAHGSVALAVEAVEEAAVSAAAAAAAAGVDDHDITLSGAIIPSEGGAEAGGSGSSGDDTLMAGVVESGVVGGGGNRGDRGVLFSDISVVRADEDAASAAATASSNDELPTHRWLLQRSPVLAAMLGDYGVSSAAAASSSLAAGSSGSPDYEGGAKAGGRSFGGGGSSSGGGGGLFSESRSTGRIRLIPADSDGSSGGSMRAWTQLLHFLATGTLHAAAGPEDCMALVVLAGQYELPRLGALAEATLVHLLDADNVFGLLLFCDTYGMTGEAATSTASVDDEHAAASASTAATELMVEDELGEGGGGADGEGEGAMPWGAERPHTASAAPLAPAAAPISRHSCNVLRVACLSFLLRDWARLSAHPDFALLPPHLQAEVRRAWSNDAHVYRLDGRGAQPSAGAAER